MFLSALLGVLGGEQLMAKLAASRGAAG